MDTTTSFLFRAGRAYFYRSILKVPKLSFLTGVKIWDVEGTMTWRMVLYPRERLPGMMSIIRDGKLMIMTKERGIQSLCEFQADTQWYTGGLDLKGKTILEGGSGCGETDFIFRAQGAKKVIGVEIDAQCTDLHRLNAKMLGWDTEIYNEGFNIQHLEVPHDFLKIDIEGAEEMFLDPSVATLGACRLELHPQIIGQERCQALVQKFNLHRVGSKGRSLGTSAVIHNGELWGTV